MPISRPQIMKDGILICLVSAATMSLAGYLHDVMLGAMSMFYLMILVNGFFGPGTYAIIGPYMTEVWPAPLRASGLGLHYGTSNTSHHQRCDRRYAPRLKDVFARPATC